MLCFCRGGGHALPCTIHRDCLPAPDLPSPQPRANRKAHFCPLLSVIPSRLMLPSGNPWAWPGSFPLRGCCCVADRPCQARAALCPDRAAAHAPCYLAGTGVPAAVLNTSGSATTSTPPLCSRPSGQMCVSQGIPEKHSRQGVYI